MFGSKQSETVVLLLQQMLAQQKDLAEQQALHHKELLAALRSPDVPKTSALPGSAEAPIEQEFGLGLVCGDDLERSWHLVRYRIQGNPRRSQPHLRPSLNAGGRSRSLPRGGSLG